MKQRIKLSQWAKLNSYTYRGAFGLFQKGKIPNAIQTETGTILVEMNDSDNQKQEHTIVYARVSSSENKANLDTQAESVCAFCLAKGWVINEVVKECASGLNENRPKLLNILKERKATRLVIEHKDRLTRFGFTFIQTLYPECEIIVINQPTDDKQDLMQDFISLVTSFCARIYGNRRSKRQTERLIQELEKNDTV